MSKTSPRDREFLTQKKSPAKNPTATTAETRVMRKISHGFRDPLGFTLFSEAAALVLILLKVVCIPGEEGVPKPPMVVLDPVLAAVLVPLEVMLDPVLAAVLDPVLEAVLIPLRVALDPVLEVVRVSLKVMLEPVLGIVLAPL